MRSQRRNLLLRVSEGGLLGLCCERGTRGCQHIFMHLTQVWSPPSDACYSTDKEEERSRCSKRNFNSSSCWQSSLLTLVAQDIAQHAHQNKENLNPAERYVAPNLYEKTRLMHFLILYLSYPNSEARPSKRRRMYTSWLHIVARYPTSLMPLIYN